MGARRARAGSLPSQWLSPGVAYVSLVLVMITGTVGLGDRLACGWLIQPGWCIVPVSAPAFLNGRLLGWPGRQIMSGIMLDLPWKGSAWRRGLSDPGDGAGARAGASGRPV